LQRLFEDADRLGATLLVWLIARDLAYATDPPEDLVATLGLQGADGVAKEAWPAWLEASRRPYDAVAAEQARQARLEADANTSALGTAVATATE
jgi:hypothetical protein